MKHTAYVYWSRGEARERPVYTDEGWLTWEAYYPNAAPTYHPAFANARETDDGWRIDYTARTNAEASERGYDALSHLASWGIKGHMTVERVS